MTTGSLAWDKFFREVQQGREAASGREVKLARKPQKRIAERLQEKLELWSGQKVKLPKRLYHGHHQRSAGAWSWNTTFDRNDGVTEIGSQLSMRECLKLKPEEVDAWIIW